MHDYKQRHSTSGVSFARKPLVRGRALLRKFRFDGKRAQAPPKGFRPLPRLVPVTRPGRVRAGHVRALARHLQLAGQLAFGGAVIWVALGTAINTLALTGAPVERVRVSGTRVLGSKEVLGLSGLRAGMNMGDADPLELTGRLVTHPRIEAADVRRVYPGAVWIDVHERIPDVRAVLGNGATVLLDAHDVVIAAAPVMRPGGTQDAAELPTVRGLTADAAPGQVLSDPALRHARDFLTLTRGLGGEPWGAAVIDAHDPNSISMQLAGRPQTLLLRQDRLLPALRIYRLLRTRSLLTGRTLDLRLIDGLGAGRVIIQP